MGSHMSCLNHKQHVLVPPPNEKLDYDEEQAVTEVPGEVYLLICAIDYSCDHVSWAGQHPLDTRYAFEMMTDLAQKCEIKNVWTLWNEQCTIEGVTNTIRAIGDECEPGREDTFIFFYSGHGDQLDADDYESEKNGKDQCLCTVDSNGATDDAQMQYRNQVWLRDDVFADAIIESFADKDAKVLVLCDSCHSATICDFDTNPKWGESNLHAISISGCQDTETSVGTGKGGMLTRNLTRGIADYSGEYSGEGASVGAIYNQTMDHYWKDQEEHGYNVQNIAIHGTGVRPEDFAWPLMPVQYYQSPADTTFRGILKGDAAGGGPKDDGPQVPWGPPEPPM